MDLNRLKHILAVARTGSFSRAAEDMHITQPALSRSVAAFEQQHGVRLFDRGRGGVSLTPAGSLVVEQARSMLAAANDLERSLRLYGRGEAGRIAVGLGPLLASLLLPRIGQSLLRGQQGLQVAAVIRSPEQLLAELIDGNVEMILGNNWGLKDAPGIVCERLGDLPLAFVVRGGHPLAAAGVVRAADLDAFPVASAVELPSAGLEGSCGSFVCDNFHILREVVSGSDCVWLSSPAFLSDELRDGRFVRIEVADIPLAHNDISVVSRTGRTRSPAAIALTAEVRAYLSGLPAQ